MARCECGALYVPSGKDVKITFRQDSLESHMYLEHETDALILDENRLVSYGNTTSQSITPNFVSISFDGPEDLAATGLMKIIVRKGSTKIIEKYFGSKNEQWVLPIVNDTSTITASCSDILNNVDIANSKIYVEIISVCDDSPGDCCGNSVSISFRNVINTICTVPVTTTPAPFIWRYSPNADRDNCIQDVNGRYLSYQECYDSLDGPDPDDPITPTTSTTCDPNDPDCTTTTNEPEGPTTTPDPNVTTTTEDPNATTTTEEATTTTTTTSAPDPNTPLPLLPNSNLTVMGGLFSEIRGGCFLKVGEYLGRYRYQRQVIDGSYGDFCLATIEFVDSTNQWMIYEGCDNNNPVTYAVAPPNGSSPWPPLTGWTNGYTVVVADCDEANYPDITFNGGCLTKRDTEWRSRPLYSDSQQVLYIYFDGTQWVYGNIPSDGSIVYFTAPRIIGDDDFAPVTGWVTAPGYNFGTPSVSRSNCPDTPSPF